MDFVPPAQRHVRGIRLGRQPAGERDGILHAQRHVGDWHRGGLHDLARDLRPLSAVCGDEHLELGIADELREPPRQQFAHLGERPSRHRDRANVREEDVAVRRDAIARGLGGPELARRDGELGMLPHDHGENVVRRDAVLVFPGLHLDGLPGRRLRLEASALLRGEQLRCDCLDLETRRVRAFPSTVLERAFVHAHPRRQKASRAEQCHRCNGASHSTLHTARATSVIPRSISASDISKAARPFR